MNICPPPKKTKHGLQNNQYPDTPISENREGHQLSTKTCSFALCLLFLPSDPPSFFNLREKRKDEKRETRDHTGSPTEDLRLGLS